MMRWFIAVFAVVAIVLVLLPRAGRAEEGGKMSGNTEALKTAIFAGGCFWCMESDFEPVKGVTDARSGFAGGHVADPSYKGVSAGGTGHREVIQVTYDPAVISYAQLLEIFWRNIDPFDAAGQFCDKGDQYTAAIYVDGDDERQAAEASKAALEKRFGKTIATEIVPAATFYPAEEYHQDYYLKNSWRYKYYRGSCGRDKRLEAIWGDEARGGLAH